jgi:hypothetical protein
MDREKAISEFNLSSALELAATANLKRIIETYKPTTLMFVWESSQGIGITTIPHSSALMYGMVSKLADAMFADDEEEEEEE